MRSRVRPCISLATGVALPSLLAALLLLPGLALPARQIPDAPTATDAAAGDTHTAALEVFDANPLYTSGLCLPTTGSTAKALSPFASDTWSSKARPMQAAAADGATLLLLRLRMPSRVRGDV